MCRKVQLLPKITKEEIENQVKIQRTANALLFSDIILLGYTFTYFNVLNFSILLNAQEEGHMSSDQSFNNYNFHRNGVKVL